MSRSRQGQFAEGPNPLGPKLLLRKKMLIKGGRGDLNSDIGYRICFPQKCAGSNR